MNDSPVFDLQTIQKKYGGTIALSLPTLEIATEEVLCLLGPTGAGKSTLLRLLAGVEKPAMGQIHFRGKRWPEDQELADRRRVTMVFQRPRLLTGTVRWNIEQGLRLRHGQRFPSETVDRIMARLGLTPLAKQSAHGLSGGQAQLVAMARALVLEPDVLLLDEPTANLDPAHVALVEQILSEEHQRRELTIVWATHHLFQARRVAQRAALLLNGELVEIASTDIFFHSPTDPRTLDFIEGRMVY